MKITAAVLAAPGTRFEVGQVDLDQPGEGEALVKIAATGLCGSDLHMLDGKRSLAPFPMVLGHEAAGTVAEVGPGVERLRPGDRVVLSIVPHCLRCPACKRGLPNYCAAAGAAMAAGTLLDGTSRLSRDGEHVSHFLTVSSFAQYAVVPESGAVVVPPDLPLDRAALISCAVLTGFGAVHNTAQVAPKSRVAVFGCGGVGLNIVQGARIAGAARIIAVDVNPAKLELSRQLGATDVVHAGEQDPVAAIRDLTGGTDYTFEALGREESIRQAWDSLDVGGMAVVVGLMHHGASVTLDAAPFIEEKQIRGCYFGSSALSRDVPRLVDLYRTGDLLLDDIISDRIGLGDLDEAFARLRAGAGARSVVVFND